MSRRWSRANPERASAAAPGPGSRACHWDTQEPANRGGAGPGVPGAGGSRQGPQHFQMRPLPSKGPMRGVRRLLQGHSQTPLGARLGADSRDPEMGRPVGWATTEQRSNHLPFIPPSPSSLDDHECHHVIYWRLQSHKVRTEGLHPSAHSHEVYQLSVARG